MNNVTREEFNELVARVAKLEGAPDTVAQSNKSQSIREFFIARSPKSQSEKAICIIYFNECIDGNKNGIDSKWLKDAFKRVKEKVPGNISDVIFQCNKKAWIQPADNTGKSVLYTITITGIKYVEDLPKKSK